MALSVASALISSRLDQLNSILYGTSLKHIARLQRIKHAAARVVMNQHSRTSQLSSSELLKQLHWLPIDCPALRDIRQKYFTASSLKDIFESVDNQNIIDFIKNAHFYHQL